MLKMCKLRTQLQRSFRISKTKKWTFQQRSFHKHRLQELHLQKITKQWRNMSLKRNWLLSTDLFCEILDRYFFNPHIMINCQINLFIVRLCERDVANTLSLYSYFMAFNWTAPNILLRDSTLKMIFQRHTRVFRQILSEDLGPKVCTVDFNLFCACLQTQLCVWHIVQSSPIF